VRATLHDELMREVGFEVEQRDAARGRRRWRGQLARISGLFGLLAGTATLLADHYVLAGAVLALLLVIGTLGELVFGWIARRDTKASV
jgi:hypothetical protein